MANNLPVKEGATMSVKMEGLGLIKSRVDDLKLKLDIFKKSKEGMSKEQIKKFNKNMAEQIEQIKKEIKSPEKIREKANNAMKKKEEEKKAAVIEQKGVQKKSNVSSARKATKIVKKAEYAEKQPKPTKREQKFTTNIGEMEDFLQKEFKRFDTFLTKVENALKESLTLIYENSEKEIKDGVPVISDKGNSKSKELAIKMVERTRKIMNKELLSKKTIDELFNKSAEMATSTLEDNEKFLATIAVDRSKLNSFKAGYISNVEAVIFNDPRRVLEQIEENFSIEPGIKQVLDQVNAIKFNRNIFKLSVVTHPRAAYKNIIADNANKQGFVFFKMVVPRKVIKTLSPAGQTALSLYLIKTIAQWNKTSDEKVANTTDGLGMHHGSQEYFYPVLSDEMDEEKKVSEEQRRELKEILK